MPFPWNLQRSRITKLSILEPDAKKQTGLTENTEKGKGNVSLYRSTVVFLFLSILFFRLVL